MSATVTQGSDGIQTHEDCPLRTEDLASLPRQVFSFLSQRSNDPLLMVCAEPGMGMADLVSHSLRVSRKQKAAAHLLKLSGNSAEAAARKVVRLARQASTEARSGKKVFVALDNVPPGDEGIVHRETKAIRRMVASGCKVLVTMLPEAAQLIDGMGEALVLTSADLLDPQIIGLRPGSRFAYLRADTAGIPALVSSIKSLSGPFGSDDAEARFLGSVTYLENLSRLVPRLLRSSLLDEEVASRLAMILLGEGRLDDIFAATGSFSPDPFELVCQYAPFFGASSQGSTFSCTGVAHVEVLRALGTTLAPYVEDFAAVFDSAVRLLASRGDYRRAAAVTRMHGSSSAFSVVAEHAPDFINVGESQLVAEALGVARTLRLGSREGLQAATIALDALGKTSYRPRENDLSVLEGEGVAQCALLVGCRAALRGDSTSGLMDFRYKSEFSRALVSHIEAVGLLRDGMVSTAFRVLSIGRVPAADGTLASALGRLDLDMARLLLCDLDVGRPTLSDEDRRLISREEFSGIGMGLQLFEALSRLMRGELEPTLLDDLAAKGERAGNLLIRVSAMVAGLIADLVGEKFVRIEAKAPSVARAASSAGLYYLSQVTRLVDDMASARIGEAGALERLRGEPYSGGLRSVARVAAQAIEDQDAGESGPQATTAPTPMDELWLVHLLGMGETEFSKAFRGALPPKWVTAARLDGSGWGAPLEDVDLPVHDYGRMGQEEPLAFGGEPLGGIRASEKRIKIRLLGTFRMMVDGKEVPAGLLDRRKARSMLVYLCVSPNQTARRYSIIDQLWPDGGYESGMMRVYQSTSVIRSALAELDPDLQIFSTSRGDRSISVREECVDCDVTTFERAAKSTLDAEGDDGEVIELARLCEELYVGDLYVPPIDVTGFVTAKAEALRALYADAMVAGAEAAARLGKYRLAIRFAKNAARVDETREDTIEVLVSSLRASGRDREAEQRFRNFAVRGIGKKRGLPPSVGRVSSEESRGGEHREAVAE